jgi:hypothetical protein
MHDRPWQMMAIMATDPEQRLKNMRTMTENKISHSLRQINWLGGDFIKYGVP